MTDTNTPASPFSTIEEAVEAFREGRMLIVVDDEDVHGGRMGKTNMGRRQTVGKIWLDRL